LNGHIAIDKIIEKAQNGNEARQSYDFILLDLHMPVLDGF
jgi:CheY-like chemotaxis protein